MPEYNAETKPEEKKMGDTLTPIAVKQLEASEKFKQPRMEAIRRLEDQVAGKLQPALQGRLNIPFDGVMAAGFIETLVAQVNKPPRIEFADPTGAHLYSAKKITAALEFDSSKTQGKWARKDRGFKRLAAISGRAIAKYYAESDPKYKSCLEYVDHYDFHCEPGGGEDLDDHRFKGVTNIFRTETQLKGNTYYDKDQVNKLLAAYQAPDYKFNEDLYRNKIKRFNALGLDPESNNYVGQKLYTLTEWVMEYEGTQYYLVFDYRSGVWVRCSPLKEVFKSDLSPFISWAAPMSDPFNFWNRGPMDIGYPVFEAIRINLNEILNNNRKRNWDMKAVDGAMFPDLSQLDYRQDGIAVGKVALGSSIQNGIYRFETPEISGALNLNAYLNNFIGEKSGITAQTQGDSNETKVGIYQGNELQISKRIKLISDSYSDFYGELALRYDWGLHEHLPEKLMVQMIGPDGVGWEQITEEDTDPDYTARVITSNDEMMESEGEKKRKNDSVMVIANNPVLIKTIKNPAALTEEILASAGFDDIKVKRIMSSSELASDMEASRARNIVELAILGKPLKRNRHVTVAYLQVLHNEMEAQDLDIEVYTNLQQYFEEHLKYAIENARHAMEVAKSLEPAPEEPEMPGGAPAPTEIPAPPSEPMPPAPGPVAPPMQ